MRTVNIFFILIAALSMAPPTLAALKSPKVLYRMEVEIEAPGRTSKSALLVFAKKNQCHCENGKKIIQLTSSSCESFVRKNIMLFESSKQPPPPVTPSTHEQTLTLKFSNTKASWSQTRSLREPVPKDIYYDFTMEVLNFCVK